MQCPDCGYVLDPFETGCPRCARSRPTEVEGEDAQGPQTHAILKTEFAKFSAPCQVDTVEDSGELTTHPEGIGGYHQPLRAIGRVLLPLLGALALSAVLIWGKPPAMHVVKSPSVTTNSKTPPSQSDSPQTSAPSSPSPPPLPMITYQTNPSPSATPPPQESPSVATPQVAESPGVDTKAPESADTSQSNSVSYSTLMTPRQVVDYWAARIHATDDDSELRDIRAILLLSSNNYADEGKSLITQVNPPAAEVNQYAAYQFMAGLMDRLSFAAECKLNHYGTQYVKSEVVLAYSYADRLKGTVPLAYP